jgi:hypothetical protein
MDSTPANYFLESWFWFFPGKVLLVGCEPMVANFVGDFIFFSSVLWGDCWVVDVGAEPLVVQLVV